ncbi:Trichothecene 3-O-acetyltransferase [Madurella mycetomatis]|uniref:Trichothecene 3-O-acetyltransferase n=1 Tax=Madurella mycetomatis TaxID=100816 RepID=A0A175W5Y2_9PEZI|nr:Trichothecene 3-O-acetyltransferase [Madurella mycetomatis]KXX81820.1 Trichothecene 3-O-acetyltransferase [Madurella mycetomatis]
MTSFNLALYQDVLGQLPRLKTYTHMLLCFPLRDDLSPTALIISLESAARALFRAFPWLAFRVVHEGSGPGNSGTFRLAPCPDFAAQNAIVRTKDCTDICPTYQEILDARGPVDMLDGGVLGPVPAFPHIYDDAELDPAPVFTLQANLVQGGLLLDAAAQHNFIDGGGLLRLLELLAGAMRGEPFSAEALKHGNCDRSTLIPLLGRDEPMLDHSHLIREPLATGAPKPPLAQPPQAARWHFVRFPSHKVTALKERANDDTRPQNAFVSTNDALSAFIWRRLSAVRLPRIEGRAEEVSSKFSRALDARRALGIPRDYLGQMGYNATCRLAFGELRDWSLGDVALHLRRAVERVNHEHAVRSWASFVAREPDKSRIMFGGAFDPDHDVGVSSLVHASVHGVEFGVLGKPMLVRRPRFGPLEGCVYLWTATGEGDVDVLLCLKGKDWEGLERDEEWGKYTEFIG